MKRLIILCLGISMIPFSWSCKEEGFTPYNEVEEFSIVSPEVTSFEIAQRESLQIEPTLTGIKPDKKYTYEWRLYDGSEIHVLSTERNLDIPVEISIGTYTFQLLVQEKTSGIKAVGQLLSLKVISGDVPVGVGWLVGNNIDGIKGQMSYIRIADEQVFLNPTEDVNLATYPEKLVAAVSGISPTFFYGDFSQLFYFTENGLRVFDSETLLLISDLNDYFYKPMQFTQIPAYGTNNYNLDQYLIHAGNLYAADGLNFGTNSDFGTFSDRLEGDYEMFPFVFKDEGLTTYFYDNKNMRFMSTSYQSRTLSVPSHATTNGQYNINNIGRKMLASDRTVSENYLSLMTDNTNYYIYAFRLRATSAIAAGYYTQLTQAPDITQLTAFAAASNVERGYYSTKNKIYKVSATTGDVTLVYEFPSGKEIVDMKLLKTGTDANKQLTVALNSGVQGEVHYVYLDDFGDRDNSRSIKIHTGFGSITNISYRAEL